MHVITIHISRRAVRVFLLAVAAFLVIGFLVPLVLMNVGGSTSQPSSTGSLFRLRSRLLSPKSELAQASLP
jgi:hypothetical protein